MGTTDMKRMFWKYLVTRVNMVRNVRSRMLPNMCYFFCPASPGAGLLLLCSLVYLGWLIRDQHTLPSCDRIFYILGMAVPFYSDQMTGRGDLSCKSEKDKVVSLCIQIMKTAK